MDILSSIKLRLNIGVSDKDTLLLNLIQDITQRLLLKINETTIPLQLEFILINAVIDLYNRLGSEGFKSENIEGVGITYISESLDPYSEYIKEYLYNTKSQNKKGVRFIWEWTHFAKLLKLKK